MEDERVKVFLHKGLNRYYEEILNFMYLRLHNRADAEDLTQETFLKAVKSIGKDREEASLRTWIFSIAKNVLTSGYEKKVEKREMQDRLKQYLPSKRDKEDPRASFTLFSVLDSLGEEDRDLLILKHYFGFSDEDISFITGLTSSHVNRIEQRLNETGKGENGDGIADDYQPIEANLKKKRQLARRIAKQAGGKTTIPKAKSAIAAVAILLFIAGLGLLSRPHVPTKTGNHDLHQTKAANQTSKLKKYDVVEKHLTFKGESKHWKAINKVFARNYLFDPEGHFVGNRFTDGYFQLVYKGDPSREKNMNFRLNISGPSRGLSLNENFPNHGEVQNGIVYGSNSSDKIKIIVKWGTHQENLVLKSQPKDYSKQSFSKVPKLSMASSLNPKVGLIGTAGSNAFRIESEILANHEFSNVRIPAYLSVDGYAKSQAVSFKFNRSLASKAIRIVGEHDELKKLLFQTRSHTPAIKTGGEIRYPAVVSFGKTGVWKLVAYANQHQIGKPIYLYAYHELQPSGNTQLRMINQTAKSYETSLKGKWDNKNGSLSIASGSSLNIRVQKLNYTFENKMLPIVVYGIPLSGGAPFVKVYRKPDVQTKGEQFIVKKSLPLNKPGKWKMYITDNQLPAGLLTFTVK